MTIAEAIAFGAEELSAGGIADPMREANSLLQFAIARDRSFTVAHPEYQLSENEAETFRSAIARRAAREPFQHIVGRQEFYGLDFLVTPDVLIPRPETELIVERAIELLTGQPSQRFLEIGVGSGCISVAVLKHCPKATAIAVDISEPAIAVARQNAGMHDVIDRLEILRSDVFENVPEAQFDLIVANPPYVPLHEYAELQPEVRDHDPKFAVTDSSTGLTIIERIVADAPKFLTSGGHLIMEIGFGQHEQVEALFTTYRWSSIGFLRDLQDIARTVDAKLA
jgi:release factor glutamine methyltransferase